MFEPKFTESGFEVVKPEKIEKPEPSQEPICNFNERIENYPERLNMYEDLAIRINELLQSRKITEEEGEKAMRFLRDLSEGRDNDKTASLIGHLAKLDLDSEVR